MAKSTKVSKPVSEVNDLQKDLVTEKVTQSPKVKNGEKVKAKFLGLVCAEYGTFYPGDVREIDRDTALELIAAGCCEIVE